MPDPSQILASAVALWHMNRPAPVRSGRANHTIKPIGRVRLGVPLRGRGRAASRARGGDGIVASFAGGCLLLDTPKKSFDLAGRKQMSLCLRLRDATGAWSAPILSRHDPLDPFNAIISTGQTELAKEGARELRRLRSGRIVEYCWRTTPAPERVTEEFLRKDPTGWLRLITEAPRVVTQRMKTDYLNGLMHIGVPVELIGPRDWHDLIFRFTGPALELFIDGVLVDEEWPHGGLHQFAGPLLLGGDYRNGRRRAGFHGQVDHLAIWDRALADDEIAALSGGSQHAAKRRLDIHGRPGKTPQYWRPDGHNAFVGDCMAYYHDPTLHIYYLYDRRHHCSKWRMGGCGYGHWSTTDLKHWTHHPIALPITDQTECALGTGCFIYHNGLFHLFYIEHGRRQFFKNSPWRGDNIFLATSPDGLHFDKRFEPVIKTEYSTGGDVNPHLLLTARHDGKFLMTVSGWKTYVSADLIHWNQIDHAALKQIKWVCTTDFSWNGWNYYTGQCQYKMSRTPLDHPDWIIPANPYICDRLLVPIVVPFKDNRRLLVAGGAGGLWGQEMVFRELVQHADGTLGTTWPAELIPHAGAPRKLSFKTIAGSATTRAGNAIRVGADAGFSAVGAARIPRNARITLRIVPAKGVKQFGLCLRAAGGYAGGAELRFDPQWQRVQFADPMDRRTAPVAIGSAYLDDVNRLDEPFTLDLIVKDDVIDACIDRRRTLLHRHAHAGDHLFLFALEGQVTFEHVAVRPLTAD